MPGWDEIVTKIKQDPSNINEIRRGYLEDLSNYTGRNTISYYSGWINSQGANLDINDGDMVGFMNAVQGLDRSKGLDLILHTPGGSPTASEAIVKYLKVMFNKDIRVIVPHMAMSAGTMICCASKEIIMGYHSSLGPIDPQFSGIPAYNIKSEFEDAQEDLQINPQNAQYWAIKLQQYPAAFMKSAIDAIDLSSTLIKEWLGDCMYDEIEDRAQIEEIVLSLNEHTNSKAHDRHYNSEMCKSFGLKVTQLEDDDELQDKVLSIHHASMICLDGSSAIKIIENPIRSFISQSDV